MALNKDERANIFKAIGLLNMPEKKQEISENKEKESWRGKPPIPIFAGAKDFDRYMKDLDKEGDLNDEEVLRALAEQVFWYLKTYQPKLISELKEKYFKDL